jgi:hypothetical protein
MIVPDDEPRGARGDGRPENRPRFDGADSVLAADGHDVRAGHLMDAAQEERREVLAVGETDQRVKGPCGELGIGHGRLGQAQAASGFDQPNFVHGDSLKLGGAGRLHRNLP